MLGKEKKAIFYTLLLYERCIRGVILWFCLFGFTNRVPYENRITHTGVHHIVCKARCRTPRIIRAITQQTDNALEVAADALKWNFHVTALQRWRGILRGSRKRERESERAYVDFFCLPAASFRTKRKLLLNRLIVVAKSTLQVCKSASVKNVLPKS